MKSIGIIANPASGKDIRRLVAYGSVFDNFEKTNIVKRILKALDALQVDEDSVLALADRKHEPLSTFTVLSERNGIIKFQLGSHRVERRTFRNARVLSGLRGPTVGAADVRPKEITGLAGHFRRGDRELH